MALHAFHSLCRLTKYPEISHHAKKLSKTIDCRDAGMRRLVSDFKLWQSFARVAEPVKVDSLVGAYRHHGNQLTAHPDAYKNELGPAPQIPLRTKLACGCLWAIPQLPRCMRWLPGKSFWLKILGLE